MSIAAFSVPSEEVELFVSPGQPDVLFLRTTNIPKVHSHLTGLRKRPDHPPYPREVWLDLTECKSFAELRGDMLVRALRLTDFLPRGFIGEQIQVKAMADAAKLPCVATRKQLPAVRSTATPTQPTQTTPSKASPAMALVETSQDMAIMQDMRRRLTVMENDYRLLAERSGVVVRALSLVRTRKEELELECTQLRTQASALQAELDTTLATGQSASVHASELGNRLSAQEAAHASFVARIAELEAVNATAQSELSQARAQAQSLHFQLLDVQNNPSPSPRLIELQAAFDAMATRNTDLEATVATGERALETQRQTFETTISTLEGDLSHAKALLVETQAELAAEKQRAKTLLSERDTAQAQGFLTSQLVEDALRRNDELTARSANLTRAVEDQKAARSALSEEHARLGLQLRQAQEQLDHAAVQASAAADFAVFQEDQIKTLVSLGGQAEEDRVALAAARQALADTLSQRDEAATRATLLEEVIEQLTTSLRAAEGNAATLTSQLARIQQANAALGAERATLQTTIASLRTTLANHEAIAANASTEMAQVAINLSQARSDLEASAQEVVQLQGFLKTANAQSEVFARALKTAKAQLITREQEHLDKEVGFTQAAAAQRETDAQEFAQAEAALRQCVAEAEDVAAALRTQVQLHQADRDSLARRLAASVEETEVVQQDMMSAIDGLSDDLAAMTHSRDHAHATIASLQSQLAQQTTLVQAACIRQGELLAQVDELSAALSVAQGRVGECEATIVEQAATLRASQDDCVRFEMQSVQMQEDITSRNHAIAVQHTELQASRQGLSEANECLARLTSLQSEGNAARVQAEATVDHLQEVVATREAELTSLQEALAATQARFTEVEQATADLRLRTQAAERLARTERLSRVQLEGELVQAQESLASLQEGAVGTSPATAIAPVPFMIQPSAADRVVRDVPAGIEVVSEGSVHVYGALRGRVHAGWSMPDRDKDLSNPLDSSQKFYFIFNRMGHTLYHSIGGYSITAVILGLPRCSRYSLLRTTSDVVGSHPNLNCR